MVSIEKVFEMRETGRKVFAGLGIVSLTDRTDLELAGCNFAGCKFFGVFKSIDFSDCNFAGTTFSNSIFEGCTFRKSKLCGSIWEMAHIKNSDLSFCDMSGCSFDKAWIKESSFGYSNMKGAVFSFADIDGLDLKSADSFGARFDSTYIRNVDIDSDRGVFFHVEGYLPLLALTDGQEWKIWMLKMYRLEDMVDMFPSHTDAGIWLDKKIRK